jgi:RsiW-degrading membrane proteinase PrsW (M82 family)
MYNKPDNKSDKSFVTKFFITFFSLAIPVVILYSLLIQYHNRILGGNITISDFILRLFIGILLMSALVIYMSRKYLNRPNSPDRSNESKSSQKKSDR